MRTKQPASKAALDLPRRLTNPTVSSAANATNESGGEAEIAGGVGVRRGAATRSLRSARGAAHSAAPCEKGEKWGENGGVKTDFCTSTLHVWLLEHRDSWRNQAALGLAVAEHSGALS